MKLMMFAASLRHDSLNKKLIDLSAKLIQQQGSSIDVEAFSKFCPTHFNADILNQSGQPPEVNDFVKHLQAADGLVIASPEYNYSIPGSLKNLIDWVSRINPMPWKACPILLMSASPSLVGGNRGLWSARIPLEACGSFVYPDMISIASAHDAFDEAGKLKDKALFDRLYKNITDFISYVEMLKHFRANKEVK